MAPLRCLALGWTAMTEVEPIGYITRWRDIVVARREQHDAACAQQGRTTDDYWARRAEGFHKFAREASQGGDALLDCVLRYLRPDDVVLDVGAGTGRHSIPLARHARRVVAIDPSPGMLRFLRDDAESAGLDNVDVVEGAWPDVADRVSEADVIISAHVLYPIENVMPFLRALDSRARRLCFLQLMVWQHWFDQFGLWEAVHGSQRLPQPTYIDALNVLHQLGCYASVEIAWAQTPRLFDSLDDAVERLAESVAVGDDQEQRARLREALANQLEPTDDGRLAHPVRQWPLATLWWEAGSLQGSASPP